MGVQLRLEILIRLHQTSGDVNVKAEERSVTRPFSHDLAGEVDPNPDGRSASLIQTKPQHTLHISLQQLQQSRF